MRIIDQRMLLTAIVLALAGALLAPLPAAAQSGVEPTGDSFRTYLPLLVLAPVNSSLEQQVVDLTNQLRQQHNCPPLSLSPQLTSAARGHSQDMADHNYFSHVDSAGHTPGWRAQQAGYIGVAGWENIAAGASTATDVVALWYNSDGHRRNMLDCSLTDIGVGYGYNATSSYGNYWTQAFGDR